MKNFSADLLALLASGVPIDYRDLITIGPTLNGQTMYITTGSLSVPFGANTFQPTQFGVWKRGKIESKIGLESSACDLTVMADNGAFSAQFAGPGPQVLTNGGFEQPATQGWQVAAGWAEGNAGNFAGVNPTDAQVIVETAQTDGGGDALQCGFVSGYTFAANAAAAACAINTVGIPVIPGESYTITGDMLSAEPAGAGGWSPELHLLFTVPGVEITSSEQSIPLSKVVSYESLYWPVQSGNGQWQSGIWTVTAPAGAALMFVLPGLLALAGASGSTTTTAWAAYFDNLSVTTTTEEVTFAVQSRVPRDLTQLTPGQLPAMFQEELPFQMKPSVPTVQGRTTYELKVDIVLVVSAVGAKQPVGQETNIPSQALNLAITAVMKAITPETPGAKQTLGGLVDSAVATGRVERVNGLPGAGAQLSVAIIPITITTI